ncbi:hypothetical protein [Kribbella sp. NPDC051137]|uniref:hypothetical protein n=1 Tax=Kribbella sp. NPDC051137 TaxID=3155045 RepID=UPI00342F9F4C
MQRAFASSMVRTPGVAGVFAQIQRTVGASFSAQVNTVSERFINSVRPQLNSALGSWAKPWVKELSEAAERILRIAWPPNLRPIADDLRLGKVLEVLEVEGIPLYLVPRAETAKALLVADGTAARRTIIGRRFDSIIEDCAAVLDRCVSPQTSAEVSFIRAALAAMSAGHHIAGQALSANVLDSMLRTWLSDDDRSRVTNHYKTPNGDVLTEDMAVREAMVMLPIWAAHKRFKRDKGDPVPYVFSRHGSVHAVSTRQYNKRNAALALMLVTSLVGFANGL